MLLFRPGWDVDVIAGSRVNRTTPAHQQGRIPLTYPGRANYAAGGSPILHTIALLNSGVGGAMLALWRRIAPFILAGLLMLHLTNAIIDGSRVRWLMVAIIALVLALNLWQQRTREQ